MALEDMLNHTCDIMEPTASQDLTGGQVITYAVLYSDVPCRMEDVPQIGEAKREIFDQPVMQNYYRTFFTIDGPAANIDRWNGKYLRFEGGLYECKERDKRRPIGEIPGFFAIRSQEYVP